MEIKKIVVAVGSRKKNDHTKEETICLLCDKKCYLNMEGVVVDSDKIDDFEPYQLKTVPNKVICFDCLEAFTLMGLKLKEGVADCPCDKHDKKSSLAFPLIINEERSEVLQVWMNGFMQKSFEHFRATHPDDFKRISGCMLTLFREISDKMHEQKWCKDKDCVIKQ